MNRNKFTYQFKIATIIMNSGSKFKVHFASFSNLTSDEVIALRKRMACLNLCFVDTDNFSVSEELKVKYTSCFELENDDVENDAFCKFWDEVLNSSSANTIHLESGFGLNEILQVSNISSISGLSIFRKSF